MKTTNLGTQRLSIIKEAEQAFKDTLAKNFQITIKNRAKDISTVADIIPILKEHASEEDKQRTIIMIGWWFGQTLIKLYGGHWVEGEAGDAIMLDPQGELAELKFNCVQKVAKNWDNPDSDRIDAIIPMLKSYGFKQKSLWKRLFHNS